MTSEGSRVLMLVDDEPAQLRLVSALAQRAGWRTVTAASPDMALARLSSRDGAMLDAVLIDSAAGDMSDLISAMRARRANVPILLLTATGSVDHAVAAMRAGAADFLVKPIAPDRLLKALDAAVEQGVEGGELRSLSEKMPAQAGFDGIVGNTPSFRTTLSKAAKAAATRQTILIEGEAGVGKETLAFAIHHKSPRSGGPFVVVHCGAVPANGIDSCLFGHEAGAFTGAFTRQLGKFAEADGGTLFLDQVDALPERAQERVRQVLQSGEVVPLGGVPQRVDFRLISASDRLLEAEVEAEEFDADLYHRLSLVHLQIPPLRERVADIPELCRQLLEQIAEQPGLRHFDITDDAIALLQGYDWPGNVRQLQAALFRAAVLGDGDALRPSDFPHIAKRRDVNQAQRAAATPGVTLFDGEGHLRTLDEIEADLIRLAISHYRGRMTEVARRLGIGRSTLYRKLAELGISEAA